MRVFQILLFSWTCYETQATWNPWGPCTRSCGGGTRTRHKVLCDSYRYHCRPSGPAQQGSCNQHRCPARSDNWHPWSPWSKCQPACGRGIRTRRRRCRDTGDRHQDCPGLNLERRICHSPPCGDSASKCAWSLWSRCSRTCGGGSRSRTRTKHCQGGGSCVCSGRRRQTRRCNTKTCFPGKGGSKCRWSGWSRWGRCSRTCGGGSRTRRRRCRGGRSCVCSGRRRKTRRCNTKPCFIGKGGSKCRWSGWSRWSRCSRTCGGGSRSRTRNKRCHGGGSCVCSGRPRQTRRCNRKTCFPASVCGKQEVTPIVAKVIGGREATPHSWPWTVRLQHVRHPGYQCGGVIISRHYVVTAAHCLQARRETFPANLMSIIAGDHDRNVTEAHEAVYDVDRIIIHPSYNPTYHLHDIALLQTRRPVTRNQHVQPICLPTAAVKPASICLVVGWGYKISGRASIARYLQQARVPVVPPSTCRRPDFHGTQVAPGMLCAGYEKGGQDTCTGDSGGPLMSRNATSGPWVLSGLTSWGGSVCGEAKKPGVYTDVFYHLQWLRTTASLT